MPTTRSGRLSKPPDCGDNGEDEVAEEDSIDGVEDQQDFHQELAHAGGSRRKSKTNAQIFIREKTRAYELAQRAQNAGGAEKFTCSICGRNGVQDRFKLEVHLRRHLKEYICACNYCGCPYYEVAELNTHMKKQKCFDENQDSNLTHSAELVEIHQVATEPESSVELNQESSIAEAETQQEIQNHETKVLRREDTRAWAIAQEATKTNGKYGCYECGLKAMKRGELEVHLRRHLKEHICACDRCNRSFVTLTKLRIHQQKECSGKQADTSEQSHQDLNEGIDNIEEPSLPLNVPSIEFEGQTNISPTEASDYGTLRKQTEAYKVAQRARKNKSGFGCEVCGKSRIRDRYDLETHLRSHFEGNGNVCRNCHQEFRSFVGLKKHVCIAEGRRNDGVSEKSRKLCRREKTRAYKMSTEAEKSEEGQFRCSVCATNVLFTRRRYLEVHLRRHFQEYLSACNTCGKMFIRNYDLKRHKDTQSCTFNAAGDDNTNDAEENEETHNHVFNSKISEADVLKRSQRSSRWKQEEIRKFESLRRAGKHSCKKPTSTLPRSRNITSSIQLSANLRQNRKLLFKRSSKPVISTIVRNSGSKLCTYCRKAIPLEERKEHRKQHIESGDKYSCRHCDRLFSHASYRRQHEWTHAGLKLKCSTCDKEYKYRQNLRVHILQGCTGSSGSGKSEVPRKSLEQKTIIGGPTLETLIRERLELPTTSSTNEILPSTTVVDSQTIDLENLISVSTNESKPISEKRFQCDYCLSVFATTKLKMYHQKSHESVPSFKKYDSESQQTSATSNKCHDEKPYKCDFCDSSFTQAANATAHVHNRHGFEIAESFSSLKIQKQKKMPLAVKSLPPISVEEAMLAAATLVTHESRTVSEVEHSRQKDALCREKMHSTIVKSNFRSTVKTTNFPLGAKKYACRYCDATYTTSYVRNYHENQHKGLKPYACGVCERRFFSAISRNHHRKKSHGPENFNRTRIKRSSVRKGMKLSNIRRLECHFCQRVFLSDASYDKHVQNRLCTVDKMSAASKSRSSSVPTYATTELFECCYCAKQFKSIWTLEGHERLHTGELPYPCTMCSRGYNSRSDLNYHLEKAHTLNITAEQSQPSTSQQAKPLQQELKSAEVSPLVEDNRESSANPKAMRMPDGMYRCDYCSSKFKTRVQKRYHENRHKGLKPYKCDVCDKCFAQPARRQEHRKNVHGVRGPVTNPGCNPKGLFNPWVKRRSCRVENARDHNVKQPNVDQANPSTAVFECSFCSQSFKTSHQKRYHENMHKGLKPYKCDACDQRFSRPARRVHHRQIVHGLRGPVQTPGCNPRDRFKRQISTRAKVDGSYKCGYCDRKFKKSYHRNAHQRIHTGEKPYQCSICDKRFRWRASAKRHLSAHQGLKASISNIPQGATGASPGLNSDEPIIEIEKVYHCQYCEDEFSSQEICERHVRVVHTEQRPFQCQLCQRGFFAKANYEKHVRNNLCDGAGLFLPTRASRRTELRQDTNVFECSYCSKQFSSKSNLNAHEQRHTGEAAVTCQMCSRYFRTHGDLLNHQSRFHGQKRRQHTVSRKREAEDDDDSGASGAVFSCYHCDAGFPEEVLLQTHIRDDHMQQRPYQCQDCHRGFFSEAAYHRHERLQLCRKVAETTPPDEQYEIADMDTGEEANENADEEVSQTDVKPQIHMKLQTISYPWIREFFNGPFIYECKECEAKFTREVIAEDHKRWHRVWDSKL